MKDIRQFTPARVGLGRAGNSLPFRDVLAFQLAHAKARDAVHFPFDARALAGELNGIEASSAARNRAEYLRRPDLGRRLDEPSRARLGEVRGNFDAVIVVADGLSALAVHRNAADLIGYLLPRLEDWRLAPVTIVNQGRVAIGDEVGFILGAKLVLVLIGERPGLSSVDSLGAYLTWSPRPGRTDAERNCVSNIRAEGLSAGAAGELLLLLMRESKSRQLSGVGLKSRDKCLGNSEIP